MELDALEIQSPQIWGDYKDSKESQQKLAILTKHAKYKPMLITN